MKKCIALASALFMGCGMASSNTNEVGKEMNERHAWSPYVTWLQSDDRMESYLRNIDDYSVESLKKTLQNLNEDHERAKLLLKKRAGSGDKKINDRYKRLKHAIRRELRHRKPAVMPAGKLLYFSYSNSNAFAGMSEHITLDGRKGKHELKVEKRQMNWGDPGEEGKKDAAPKEVGDSVFQRVREMVEEGKLYEVGRSYQPDVDITDASSWLLEIVFEQGFISSSGYAEGPDHSKALNAITDYLTTLAPDF